MSRLILLLSVLSITACAEYDPNDVRVEPLKGNPEYHRICSPQQSENHEC